MTDELDTRVCGRSVHEWVADLDGWSAEKRDLAVAALAHGGAAAAWATAAGVTGMPVGEAAEAYETVLAAVGEAAVAPLMAKVDLEWAPSVVLEVALAAVGAPAVPAVWAAAADRGRGWVGRVRCLEALAAMRPQPPGAGDLLVRTMYDAAEPEPVRLAAAAGVASWARPWVEADPVGAVLLAGCGSRDERIRDVAAVAAQASKVAAAGRAAAARDPVEIAAAVERARAAQAAREAEPTPPAPAGWRAHRREDGLSLDLEYFDGAEWTGAVAVSGLSAGEMLELTRCDELLASMGPEFAGAPRDAATVARLEHDDDLAQAAGYRVVESRRAEAAAAAQRLRDLGASVSARRGEAGIDELVEVLARIAGRADAERARGLLRGGWTSAEL